MSNELKCSIMASVLLFGVGLHGAARTGSGFGYAVAAMAIIMVVIGLWRRE